MPVDEVKVRILRRKIEDVNAAIIRRNQGRTLEQQRSDLQGELNAEMDIITRLPLELSSDIFVRCLPTFGAPAPNPHDAPMVFLSVSRSWAHIARSAPVLWANIRIEFPRATNFDKLVHAWLSRADPRDTSISLRGSLHPAVGAVVQQHAQRVRDLKIYFRTANRLPQITAPFPSLRTLTIALDDADLHPPEFFGRNPMKCVQMMLAAPNLVKCSIEGTYFKEQHNPLMPLTHPSLQSLWLDGPGGTSAAPLQYLTLPALHTLHVGQFDIDIDDFLSFLRRSAPPLESLSMQNPVEWSPEAITEFSQLLPSVQNLELSCGSVDNDYGFLGALATTQNFFPNLRNLTMNRLYPNRTCYENLVGAFSARRSQIQSFRLIWSHRSVDADIREALRRLVAEGMHIQISGDDKTNLI